uniref:Uncharacterized protein n=1 Tax=Magallana gigas TaxID=29159 RepID=K1P5T7_MAGGI
MHKFYASAVALLVLCSLLVVEAQIGQSFHGGGGGWRRCPWGYRPRGTCYSEWECGYRGFCYRGNNIGFGRYGTCCVRRWRGGWNDNNNMW